MPFGRAGGGTSQTAFGARSGATVLSRATTVCAVLFMLGGLMLGIIGQRGLDANRLDGVGAVQHPALPHFDQRFLHVAEVKVGGGHEKTRLFEVWIQYQGTPARGHRRVPVELALARDGGPRKVRLDEIGVEIQCGRGLRFRRGTVALDFVLVAEKSRDEFRKRRHDRPGIPPGQQPVRGSGTRFCVSGPFPDTLPNPSAPAPLATTIELLINGVVVGFERVQHMGRRRTLASGRARSA